MQEMSVKRFRDVVGHKEIISHLQNAISAGKTSHAYLFGGETGSGKKTLAALLAMTLQCQAKGTEPCLVCPSCKKMLSGNHPDIIRVTHEKPASIGIDEIRAQLVNDMGIKPYESPYKIYIVDEAQKLTLQAQNAMLKTIEEPPAYGVVLLLADNPDALLPTITSRCVQLNLKPVDDRDVKRYLVEQLNVPMERAEVHASFAQGNIGKAIEISGSAEFSEVTAGALDLMKKSRSLSVVELADTMKRLAAEKQNIGEYLELFVMWFRDVLMFKATKEADQLIFKDEIKGIRERAAVSSYEGIQEILDAIHTADSRLRANVNPDLVLELLFLTIREN